uniref:putative leucine-rich repeat receptor-like serine/threonine-protein kinase At2g24130 n=1 Tax=Fragaria vesca subsp. vesca TaxID=101020 RepID=UPI0005C98ED5|nr:PREDICTED: putative leucine-rich repeat receptor-like serine/threonine-protein kinase At2g24130 [Fragaria vesca subsp. vesca]
MVFIKTIFFLLFQHFVITSCNAVIGHHHTPHHSLLRDKAALLQLKKAITYDPNSTLANWNEGTDVCNFTGVGCNKQRHRVTELLLHDHKLVGKLSPIISNLTGLRYLELVGNHFYGTLPPEISLLRRLHHLRIEGNNFPGSIPDSLVLPSQLTVVTLLQNNFSGAVPPALFSNCSVLRVLDISNNFLSGKIPREIGNCPNLWTLNLYNNQFTGEIPFSLTNTSLVNLDVEFNHLSGELPVKLVENLPHILYLHLSNNDMVSHDGNTNLDPFFTALANCTSLEELELASMGLGGTLPSSIGGLGVNFTNLLLQENQLIGSVPSNIGNISKLVVLNLTSNLMNGTISANISHLSHLEQLFLSHNFFTSTIPEALGHLPHLGLLDLSHNSFFGNIPSSLGNLARLNYLFLNNNLLSGTIPPALGRCTELYRLDLSFNRLAGLIPPELSGLSEIRIFINLSHNHLEGSIPIELSKLEDVQEMDLSSNNLSGSIFPQISSCIALTLINFSHNALEGSLPDSIGELKNLVSFDVSDNHLSGKIPMSLNKSRTLTYLNLSYNDFEGKVPYGGIFELVSDTSFLGNKHLCGKLAAKHVCPRTKHLFRSRIFLIIFVIVIFISTSLSIICCVIAFRRVKVLVSPQKAATVKKPTQPEVILNFPRVTYRDLSEATGGFDDQRLIGTGSYGRVYRGVLPDGTTIAVKVLHLQSGNSTKSFNRECQVLRRIRHRNLIRIITACSLPDFKAIVLPYMANGSLDSRLYPHSQAGLGSGSSDLSLIQRVNICSDIAEGMAYLHHYSPVRVIHCDLKPSNVLLNDDMTALVSDFGIARLVIAGGAGGGNAAGLENMGNSTANILCGSIGYIAPEYGFGSSTSTKGDVYSFGVLVLEMVTRKRPIDDMFVGGLSLHSWVKNHYHGRIDKVVDSSLLRASRDQSPEVKKMWDVAIEEMIELGILCTQESPSTRPTMVDAADDLDRLKRYLGGDTTATFASSLGISSSTIDDD